MRTGERFFLPAVILLLLMVLLPGTALGQAVYGSIFGTVTDPTGAAVNNATVTITDVGRNVTVTVKTNVDGNYNQTRLIPGTYRIKVEATGFKTAVLDTVVVN